jgi:hypothetical protein
LLKPAAFSDIQRMATKERMTESDPEREGRPDIGPDEADHADIEQEKDGGADYEVGKPDIQPA